MNLTERIQFMRKNGIEIPLAIQKIILKEAEFAYKQGQQDQKKACKNHKEL